MTNNYMDISIPTKTKEVLDRYLKPLSYGSPDEMLLLSHLVFISRVLCYNRVRIEKEGQTLFPNIYGMCFLGSGRGKDRTVAFLSDMYQDFTGACNLLHDAYRERRIMEIEEYIENKSGDDGKSLSNAQKQRMRDEMYPRPLINVLSSGTVEGLHAMRVEYQFAGFGAVHFQNSEFIDYIKASDQNRLMFLTYLKEIYEHGNSEAKITKSDPLAKPVSGIPQTMLVHSSLSGLVDDQNTSVAFKEFLERGNARRCIVCCPEDGPDVSHNEDELSYDEDRKRKLDANAVLDTLRAYARDVYIATTVENGGEPIVMKLSDEANRAYYEYEKKNRGLVKRYRHRTQDSEVAEIGDRARRAVRVAACLAAFEHPESLVIEKSDFEIAVSMINMYADQFERVANLKRTLDSEKMISFILNNQETKEVTRMMIYKQPFAPSNRNQWKGWFESVQEDVREICQERGLCLVELNGARNTKHYRIEKEEEVHEEVSGDIDVTFSFTSSKVQHPTQGYKQFTRPFSTLHKDLTKGYCYSPAEFKDGYRKGANVVSLGNCLMIDIDDGLSIEEAKARLGEYKTMIITTQSHRKDKGGVVCDRYRILVPLRTAMAPQYGYKEMVERILDFFGIKEETDVAATCDKARYFKPSPEDATYWYSGGSKILSWEAFDIETQKPRRTFQSPNKVRTFGKVTLAENVVLGASFKERGGMIKGWDDYEYLQVGETSPVHCLFPEKHNNGDKHPSAFISRHEGGALMMKCTGCGSIAFNK